jgi:hypothetical protein
VNESTDTGPRTNSVSSYFRKLFFLFVPNVCDAACDFCYIRPLQGSSGHLAPGVLRRAQRFLQEFRQCGFAEVRFTGGEPLVFDNIAELFSLASEDGLRYTLLTNGINLRQHLTYFEGNPPSKVTVSVHSLRSIGAIFGVERDPEVLTETLQALRELDIPVAATLVLDSVTRSDLEATITQLREVGVRDVKLIAPNVVGADPRQIGLDLAWAAATSIAILGDGARVRHSSLTTLCLLKDEATISVQLPSGNVGVCCATVGDWEPVGDMMNSELPVILAQAQTLGLSAGPLPCAAHYGACPIALESIGTSGDGVHVS